MRAYINSIRISAALLIATAVMILCGSAVSAESVRKVYDEAGLLSAEQADSLESTLDAAAEKYGHDIVVCTVNSLDGYEVEEYAEKLVTWKDIGINGSGIIYLVAMNDRKYDIYAFGEMGKTVMTRSICNRLASDLQPRLTSGDYYGAFRGFADKCVSETEYTLVNGPNKEPSCAIPVGLAVGFLTGLVTVLIMKSGMTTTRPQITANNYIRNGSFRLTQSRDIFLYSTVSRTARSSSSSNSSSGGGGGHHSSGSF